LATIWPDDFENKESQWSDDLEASPLRPEDAKITSKWSLNRCHAGHLLYFSTAGGWRLPKLRQNGALIDAMPATSYILPLLEAGGCQNYVKMEL
jgi:hypothetical protein